MVHFILVQLLILFTGTLAFAGVPDGILSHAYLGEKNLNGYAERYEPIVFHDIYRGVFNFQDDLFFSNFFRPNLLPQEESLGFFMRSELSAGLSCSNEKLSEHFDEIRYSYRLISLSYLLEGNWQLRQLSEHFMLKDGCDFDLQKWLKSCGPKSTQMKKFIERLTNLDPKFEEVLPRTYRKDDWIKEFNQKKFTHFSHYRLNSRTIRISTETNLQTGLKQACEEDKKLMSAICNEQDELYGLSLNRDAYYLLGQSNIINTYNQSGEAQGCMRRFSEVMSHKEKHYPVLGKLFPPIREYLKKHFLQRFPQGRVFFYGSSKEFDDKGLDNYLVKNQPLKIAKLPQKNSASPSTQTAVVVAEQPVKKVPEVKVEDAVIAQTEVKEIRKPQKSAFLQAAETLKSEGLSQVEVDMLKLKYDYVFTLDVINNLSDRLGTFMTREALKEMMNFDKLGTKNGPVPLLFLKYMIDMEEHQGLWNLLSVLGTDFYVSNEIDSSFSPEPEFIRMINDASTGNQWQIYILRK